MQIHQTGELFHQVQMQRILGDGKTFPDCIPNRPLEEIKHEFEKSPALEAELLKAFVIKNFTLPVDPAMGHESNRINGVWAHIRELWTVLSREPSESGGSLIVLPYKYIVPGGRFREIYYWDSYFAMEGLRVCGQVDMIRNMVDNLAFLIDKFGYVPNGNRTYYLGRSQPPLFALMVDLLAGEAGDHIYSKYLTQLEREYQFWMLSREELTSTNPAVKRVVLLENGLILNRFWDTNDTPRPEAYREDMEHSKKSLQPPQQLFRNIRAAAESGWDFSTRWFKNPKDFGTIHTTDLIPVDLNCQLLHLERTLAKIYELIGNEIRAADYYAAVQSREYGIRKYCWNSGVNFFTDYDFRENIHKSQITLAAASALFFKVATESQAEMIIQTLESYFLKSGGLVTTLEPSLEQWDSPNGWAPLQWFAYQGLKNYGYHELASRVKTNWLSCNEAVFDQTGELVEKYNVCAGYTKNASGGEYPNQFGFGWTNGVYLAMSGANAE